MAMPISVSIVEIEQGRRNRRGRQLGLPGQTPTNSSWRKAYWRLTVFVVARRRFEKLRTRATGQEVDQPGKPPDPRRWD